MLSDVMEHFGFTKSLRQVGYFETTQHQQLLKELKVALQEGGLIALTGVVGSGKTVLLWRIQDVLRQEGHIQVAESLTFDCPAGKCRNAETGPLLRSGGRDRRRPPSQTRERRTRLTEAHPAL